MRAHLVLKSPITQLGMADALPTAETIKNFMASPDAVQEVVEVAQQLGFKVLNSTPMQVTIEGTKGLFEEVFSSPLTPVSITQDASSSGIREETLRETPANFEVYTWGKAPRLPTELKNSATEVILPQSSAMHL